MHNTKITNTTYTKCPQCGTEAHGFDEIFEKFGYRMKRRGDVVPNSVCKKCHAVMQQEKNVRKHIIRDNGRKQEGKQQVPLSAQWLPSAVWARKMHVKEDVFVSCLLELDYLAEHPDKKLGIPYMITEKGREHSALTNAPFYKTVLWDYQAFSDVLMYRAGQATYSMHCPYCHREQERRQAHGDFFEVTEECPYCGKSSRMKEIHVAFER